MHGDTLLGERFFRAIKTSFRVRVGSPHAPRGLQKSRFLCVGGTPARENSDFRVLVLTSPSQKNKNPRKKFQKNENLESGGDAAAPGHHLLLLTASSSSSSSSSAAASRPRYRQHRPPPAAELPSSRTASDTPPLRRIWGGKEGEGRGAGSYGGGRLAARSVQGRRPPPDPYEGWLPPSGSRPSSPRCHRDSGGEERTGKKR
jgi:hypothetical protein